MASATQLSHNDTTVLRLIFDPENASPDLQQSQPVEQPEASSDRDLDHVESRVIQSLNEDEVPDSTIRQAITAFDEILKADPKRASAYNDRAQARRMLHNMDELYSHAPDVKLIMQDLNSAIQYASSTPSSTAAQAKVLSAAYTHRGYLYLQCSKDAKLRSVVASIGGDSSLDSRTCEEIASRDFVMGGKFGNALAKRMAVHTNPYAKLCGEMVKQAMQAELGVAVARM
jgi:hypothetical protein